MTNNSLPTKNYRGRFAPSPTGPLHFGSLVTAVGSYLEAKSRNGEWLVRIENQDKPREAPNASDQILRSLEVLGMEWDHKIIYQYNRNETYENVLSLLNNLGLTYSCVCTRKEIADSSISGVSGQIYPGTCRNNGYNKDRSGSIRIRTNNNIIEFTDTLYGHISQKIENEIGDFILRRSDKIYSYQLAVVVDDAAQNITNIVRGADLLDSTPRQIYLQQALGYTIPAYMHLPVVMNKQGMKLSKQNKAAYIDLSSPIKQLIKAINFLGQEPPIDLSESNISSFWEWAIQNWDPEKINIERALAYPKN